MINFMVASRCLRGPQTTAFDHAERQFLHHEASHGLDRSPSRVGGKNYFTRARCIWCRVILRTSDWLVWMWARSKSVACSARLR